MPKEGDKMSKVKRNYFILFAIILIECIPYGIIKSIIVSDHIVAQKQREEDMKNPIEPVGFPPEYNDDINDRLEKYLDFLFPLGVLITLAVGNKIIKSNKLKWVIYGIGVISIWTLFRLITYINP